MKVLRKVNEVAGQTGGHDWSSDVMALIRRHDVGMAATVPDGGLTRLLQMLEAEEQVRMVTVATEEEGVALLCGAWLGGCKGVLLLQSSGVGNIINMLSMPVYCRIPVLMLVTMRGQQGEFNPWQVTMGKATPRVLEAVGVTVYPIDKAEEVGPTMDAAAEECFRTGNSAAVLVGQRVVGVKKFGD